MCVCIDGQCIKWMCGTEEEDKSLYLIAFILNTITFFLSNAFHTFPFVTFIYLHVVTKSSVGTYVTFKMCVFRPLFCVDQLSLISKSCFASRYQSHLGDQNNHISKYRAIISFCHDSFDISFITHGHVAAAS